MQWPDLCFERGLARRRVCQCKILSSRTWEFHGNLGWESLLERAFVLHTLPASWMSAKRGEFRFHNRAATDWRPTRTERQFLIVRLPFSLLRVPFFIFPSSSVLFCAKKASRNELTSLECGTLLALTGRAASYSWIKPLAAWPGRTSSVLSPHKSRPLLAFVRFVAAAMVVTIPYQAAPLLHSEGESAHSMNIVLWLCRMKGTFRPCTIPPTSLIKKVKHHLPSPHLSMIRFLPSMIRVSYQFQAWCLPRRDAISTAPTRGPTSAVGEILFVIG